MTAANQLQDDAYLEVIEIFLEVREQSIFSHFSQRSLKNLLAMHTRLVECSAGEMIKRTEKPAHLYVVARGTVGLYDSQWSRRKEGEVSTGRSIELDVLLTGADRWKYAWVAETPCTLLAVDAAEFGALLDSSNMREYLTRVSLSSDLHAFKRDLKLFGLATEQMRNVVAGLTPAEADPQTLAALKDTFIVVRHGSLGVSGRTETAVKRLGELNEGDYSFIVQGYPRLLFKPEAGTTVWLLSLSEFGSRATPDSAAGFARLVETFDAKLRALETAGATPQNAFAARTIEEVGAAAQDDDGLDVIDFKAEPRSPAQRLLRRRKPVAIKQHDAMDCAAACLAMVSKHYGRRIGIPAFRSLVSVTKEGASMMSMRQGARHVGFDCIGIVSAARGLLGLRLPLVALMQYHYVVVYELSENGVLIGDPAVGLRTLSFDEFTEQFSRNCLLLKPRPELMHYPESESSYRKYFTLLRGQGHNLFMLAALAGLSFIIGLAAPVVTQFVFDSVLVQQKYQLLPSLMIASAVVALVNNGVGLLQTYFVTYMTTSIDASFSALFLRHVYRLPMNYFAVRNVGDLTTRLGELEKIRHFLTEKPIDTAVKVVSVAIYSTAVALYSVRALATVVVFLPLILGFLVYVTPKVTRQAEELYHVAARTASLLVEQVRGIATIKTLDATVAARSRWRQSVLKSNEINLRSTKYGAGTGVVSAVLTEVINQALFIVLALMVMRNEMALGQMVAVSLLARQIVGPAIMLVNLWSTVKQAEVSFARIDDVVTSRPEQHAGAPPPGFQFKGAIEMRDVVFQYGGELSPMILNHVSLKIEAGETVALVGPSGSGKTSLVYMVNLLFAPVAGEVLIDGVEARRIPLRQLRRGVAMIMQEKSLFSGTVIENIALGDPHPDFDRVVAAARAADAHEFVARMKNGYLSKLGEGGSGLSGGQRQRICIARALYVDPPIMILDEATASLDAVSEANVIKNIKARQRRRTTIIIAHRLNTVMHADTIHVMEKGVVVESGSHEALMAKQGKYHELFRKQLNV